MGSYSLAKVTCMKGERLFEQGMTCLDQKNYEGAKRAFEQAVEKFPRDGAAWAMLGLAWAKGGDRPGAMEAYKHALSLITGGKLAEVTHARLASLTDEGRWANEERKRHEAEAARQQTLDKFKKFLRVSRRVKLPQIAQILGATPADILDRVVDWAAEFGFTLDGDDLNLEGGRKDDFIDAFDHLFAPATSGTTMVGIASWFCPACGQENRGNPRACQGCGTTRG